MATGCIVDDAAGVLKGDALCLVGWDGGSNKPKVARATRAALLTSKTVYGIAEDDAIDTDPIQVLVAGDVAKEDISDLGAGDSRIIATDINQVAAADQCRLKRIDRPDGSEHVVGTCDETGHLALEPRASRDRSPHHLLNVNVFGARADGKAFHDAVMEAASTTLTSAAAGFASDDVGRAVRVVGAGVAAATLITTIAAFTSDTEVVLSAAATTAVRGSDAVLWTTDNSGAIAAAVAAVPSRGGVLLFPSTGVYVMTEDTSIPAHVQVLMDEGATLAPIDGKTLTIEGRIRCHANQHVLTGIGDIVVGSTSFTRLNVKNWGAHGDGINDDLPAFRTVLRAMDDLLPGDAGGELFIPSGVYSLDGTLGDELARIPINTILRGVSAGGEAVNGDRGTVLEFRSSTGDGLIGFYNAEAHVAANVVIQDLCIKDGHVAPPRGPVWTPETRVPLGQAVLPRTGGYNGMCYVAAGPLWRAASASNVGLPALGDYVYPTTPNGFYYECTRAPIVALGPFEPSWPTTPGLTIDDPASEPVDGAEWTCRAGMIAYTGKTDIDAAEPDWSTATTAGDLLQDGSVQWTAVDLPRREDVYGFDPALGDVALPTTPNGHYYVCIQAGVVAAEPAPWPTDPGEEVPDGTAIWKEAGPTLAPVWRADWDPAEGQTVLPEATNGFYYTRTTAPGGDPTGMTEPIWPTVINATVMDGAHVEWTCTGKTRAGLRFEYGAHMRVERLRFAGWQFSMQLEGPDDLDISHIRTSTDGDDWAKGVQFPNSGSVGVVVGVGDDTAVRSTSTTTLHNCSFGSPETAVVSNGGSGLHVHSNSIQFAEAGQFAKIHGSAVSIWENNLVADPAASTRCAFRVTGTPSNVTIRNNSIVVPDRAGIVIEQGLNGFTLTDNSFITASPDVRGILLTTGPNILLGNTFQRAPYFDADTCAGAMLTMNTPDAENSTKLGVHTCIAQASLDLLHGSGSPDFGGFPAIIVRNANDQFFEHSILTETPPHKQRIRHRVPDDAAGKDGGTVTILEMKGLDADETDDICAFTLPDNCTALVTWTLVGRRTGGIATWKRSQMLSCATVMAVSTVTFEPANTAPPAMPAGPVEEVGPLTSGAPFPDDDGTYFQGFLYATGATIAVKVISDPADTSAWQCDLRVVILQGPV